MRGRKIVKMWRRKVINFSSTGIFMFSALVNGNHCVLAEFDIDGQQFFVLRSKTRTGHTLCYGQSQNVDGKWSEERTRRRRMEKFWLVVVENAANALLFPRKLDAESCGVFVGYVAEHLDRGARPSFTQEDIRALRARSVWALHDAGNRDLNRK